MVGDDVENINTNVSLNHVYRGVCAATKTISWRSRLMHFCFTSLLVHTRHDTYGKIFWWHKLSVWNPGSLKDLYRTRHMVQPIHTCKSGPSGFRPGTTSYVMFPRYLLHSYGTAYIAGMLDSHYIQERFHIFHLYIEKSTSAMLGPLLQKAHEFKIWYFDFRFIYDRDYAKFPDYSTYEITYECVTLHFRLVLVDASPKCGLRPCIIFLELVWEIIKIFTFLNYAYICVPLDTIPFLPSALSLN